MINIKLNNFYPLISCITCSKSICKTHSGRGDLIQCLGCFEKVFEQ